MNLTLRSEVGRPLTASEFDGNFSYLLSQIQETVGLDNLLVTGLSYADGQIRLELADGTSYQCPVPLFVDAPEDTKLYGRRDGGWAEIDAVPEAPADGTGYVRKDGDWAPAIGMFRNRGLHDVASAYEAFDVVSFDTAGTVDLWVALVAVPANGSVPGDGVDWRRLTTAS